MAPRADPLARYREKRDFSQTSEPQGAVAPPTTGDPRFVVQRHRASHLHYDLRLEIGGVLASWSVPKGPTLDPKVRRLAVEVEDHPLDYFDFEGVIPDGSYGAGDVVVWDWGTWTSAHGDPVEDREAGDLHLDLRGEKLVGRFALVRRGRGGDRAQWILIHKDDDAAVPGWDAEDHPRSVRSGLTNDEVAALGGTPPAATWSAPTDDELAELDALRKGGTWSLGGDEVKLTNLDKVLFPGREGHPPITKRDLIRYQARIAPHALPYLADRPVNLHRYPDGADGQSFWYKAVPKGAPDWLTTWDHAGASEGKTVTYSVLDRPAALAYVANLGALEVHPWTSSIRDEDEPTWALIDLDPGTETTWEELLQLARLHRTALDHLGVRAMPKVTGKRGIQIWIPVARGHRFEDTSAWVEAVSRAVGATVPELVSWEWQVSERKGLARLDYTQNAVNKTLVAPFSTRPAPGAPVSIPITWDELDDPDLRPDRWALAEVFERIEACGDPLRPLIGLQQELPPLR
jgi:bifunctional non-homologous end joining protein LigD